MKHVDVIHLGLCQRLMEDKIYLTPSITCRSGEEVRGEEEEGPQGEVSASLRSVGATGEGDDVGLGETVCLHTCGRSSCGAAGPRANGGGEDRWVKGAAEKSAGEIC